MQNKFNKKKKRFVNTCHFFLKMWRFLTSSCKFKQKSYTIALMKTRKIFYFLMIMAMFFWGLSWASSKVLINYADAYTIAFWRFFFVFVGIFFLLVVLKIPLTIHRHFLKWIFLASVCNVIYSVLYFAALNYGAAGKGGVLVTTLTPVFTYLLVIFIVLWRTHTLPKMPLNEIFGLCLGIVSGILLLNLGSLDELFGKYNVFFILCALDWAILSLFTQKIHTHPLVMNFYITFFSLFAFVPIFFDAQTYFIFKADLTFWFHLFCVAILSTLVGTSIYYLGIKELGSAKANSFLLLVPASALLCSFLILDEKPTLLTLFGTALAVCGIYLINGRKLKK